MVPNPAVAASWNINGKPIDNPLPVVGSGMIGDIDRPRNSAGTRTANPAIGPAIPMSKRTRRFGNASLILMTAPSVPVIGRGAGMKYGSVASTLYRRQGREGPISREPG